MKVVNPAWQEATATLRPRPDSRDGPLPPLLLTLTVVTGLVDATSYLKLGHVFVANMTGNVVFLGFGIAGAGVSSTWASLTALGAFLVGGAGGGRIGAWWSTDRGRQLTVTTSAELVLVTGALVIAALSSPSHQIGTASRYAVIVLLAIAMGIQNAAARRLAVADLTTTVLTMTLTGIAADAALAGGHGSKFGRRALSVTAMLLGALIGGLLVLKVDNPAPLALAAGLLAMVSFFTYRASRSTPAWADA
jgi:uncharacterized membrane protein YoaK (UPF0700 family)